MTGLIPRLQSHLVLTALAVLTALWPPIGHPALEVQENRLLLTTGAGRHLSHRTGGKRLGRWLGPAPLGHHQEGREHGRGRRYGACRRGTVQCSRHNEQERDGRWRIQFISDTTLGAHINTAGSGNDTCWLNNGSYVTIQGFDISAPGDPNVRIGIANNGSNCQIIGNRVHDILGKIAQRNGSGGAGIVNCNTTSTSNDIIDNWIYNIGNTSSSYNTIHGIYISCIGGNVWNNISFNNQGAGIHAWHNAQSYNICNNLVWGNGHAGIIIGCGDSGYTRSAGRNFKVNNNIILYNNGAGVIEEAAGGAVQPSKNTYNTNLCYGNIGKNNNDYTHTVHGSPAPPLQVNPLLINFQADGLGDYHLAAGSPCINAGTSQGAPTTDYDGLPRPQGAGFDIGPYEWVPPGSRGTPSPGRSAAASQVDRSQHAPMLYALLGVSGVALVLLVALVFVLRIRKAS